MGRKLPVASENQINQPQHVQNLNQECIGPVVQSSVPVQ